MRGGGRGVSESEGDGVSEIGIESADQTYPLHTVGDYSWGGDRAECVSLHESPPDQETMQVVLLDCFICTERGPRHQFKPCQLQEDL